MNKTNWFLGVFISGAMFLFACSSPSPTICDCSNDSSSSVGASGDSSSSIYSSSSVGASGGSSSSIYSSSSSMIIVEDQDLVRKNIKISVDSSYADLDGEPVAYTKTDAASRLDKIDLIAHCGTSVGWCEKNSIYSPFEIDLFYNRSDYIGYKYIYIYKIPNEQSAIFKTATRLYEILPTYNNLASTGIIGGEGVEEVSIEEGKVFFVVTSENKYRIVIIKQAGAQSVDLEIIEIPSN